METTLIVINTGNKVFGNIMHDASRPWAVAFVCSGRATSVWSRHATRAGARRKCTEVNREMEVAANTDWSKV